MPIGFDPLSAGSFAAAIKRFFRGGTDGQVWTQQADGTPDWEDAAASPGGVSDGDKGDIVVSGSGATWTIDTGAVTYAKMQDVSAAERLLGRGAGSGSGDAQELTLGSGLSMSGTALSAADTGDYLKLAGRSGGQVVASADSAQPTVALKRYNNAADPILEWQKEDGTPLGEINALGYVTVAPGANSTDALLTLTQGPSGGALDPNLSLLLDAGTAVTTFNRAALELRAGPSGGYQVAHIDYQGQFRSFGKYDNTGISVGAPYDDATYDEDALLISGANEEAIINLQGLSGTQRVYTLPDKNGTFAMLDDISGGSGLTHPQVLARGCGC